MPAPVSRRTAIVTGGSRGIGKAVALRLAKDGFAVLVNHVSKGAEAVAVVAGMAKSGGQAVAVQADVAEMPGAGMLFELAEKQFGGVDVVVNNAGVIDLKPMA